MAAKSRLTMLLHFLRSPTSKPPVNVELDERLDAVDKRLRKLSPEGARRAREIVRQGR